MTKFFDSNTVVARAMRVLSVAMAAVLVVGCMPSVVETDGPHRPARSVLIVTGAGMVPHSATDPRYESTWLQVASSYAEALRDEISRAGAQAQLHTKRNRNEQAADVVAGMVSTDRRDALLQVTVNHVKTSSENTIYLKAEFLPLQYKRLSNGRQSMTPLEGPTKKYPILSTTAKDMRDASLPALAKQFVQELRGQGYLR